MCDDDVVWAAAAAAASWWSGRLRQVVPVPWPSDGQVREFEGLIGSAVAHDLRVGGVSDMDEEAPAIARAMAEAGFDPFVTVFPGSVEATADRVAVRDGTSPGPVVTWHATGWVPPGLCQLGWARRAGLTSAVRCGLPWGHLGRCGAWRKIALCSSCGRDAVECWDDSGGCEGGRPMPAGTPWSWPGWRG